MEKNMSKQVKKDEPNHYSIVLNKHNSLESLYEKHPNGNNVAKQ